MLVYVSCRSRNEIKYLYFKTDLFVMLNCEGIGEYQQRELIVLHIHNACCFPVKSMQNVVLLLHAHIGSKLISGHASLIPGFM